MKIAKIGFYDTNSNYHNNYNVKHSDLKQTDYTNKALSNISFCYFQNINFNGDMYGAKTIEYTHKMGERVYSKRNVMALAEVYKETSGITLGRGIPNVWLSRVKDVESFDKESFIKEFGIIFNDERKFSDVDVLQKRLSTLFKKYDIIDDATPFSVKYIGQGFQAWAYKISIGPDENSSIAVKLFKRKYNYLQNHGNHTEQNLAEYIRQYAGDKSEFTTYYLGDTKNGILLTDYISPNSEQQKHILDLTDIGLRYNDEKPDNRRNGTLLDFGGLITDSNLMGNMLAINVHRHIKYAKTYEDKLRIFNQYYKLKNDSDIFKNIAIGLTHSIKHFPVEMQEDLYKKMYDLGSNRVNIALIQCIKYFKPLDNKSQIPQGLSDMIRSLTTNVVDVNAQETIAKEIANMPTDVVHRFFDEHADTNVSAIIKYLSRHMNLYYKPVTNRKVIYDKFLENSDRYAAISMINNMKYMNRSRYDEYFERFFAKNDSFINMTLARNLELFNDDEKTQKKWIDKLMETDNVDVIAGLCESVSFVERDLRAEMFDKLLNTNDKVCKEFLAHNIVTVPGHLQRIGWVEKLLDGAGNMVRMALIESIKKLPQDSRAKNAWIELVAKDSNQTIKTMLSEL